MKNVGLIAGRELVSYVKTPSGYIIAAIVLLWQGIMLNAYALGRGSQLSTDVLMRFFEIAGGTAIVTAVIFSMRLLAEERSTGTQVLLFTSPVREWEMVLGKYLAGLSFIVVVVLLSMYLPALILIKGKISWGHIFAGYLGTVLLGASTLAIGTFASSLVKHPFLAVLLTGGFAAMLEATFFLSMVSDGAAGEVLAYFSPYYTHFRTSFLTGILQLSDIMFFLTLIYLSLLSATYVLKGQRWR